MDLLLRRKMRRAFAGAVIAFLFTVYSVVGQSTFGSIVGVVHDTSQGFVPGASVQLRSLEDNSIRSTTAGADGSFEFTNLKPGNYVLSVQADGFADYASPSAQLNARQALRIDVTLSVKSQSQT